MADLPWRSFAEPAPDREYVALLTFLPLTGFWALPQFFYYTGRISSQLKSTTGLVGYSLRAHVLARSFWTLSVWDSEAALQRFVRQNPHQKTMTSLRSHMGNTSFTRWKLDGAAVPPSWSEATERAAKMHRSAKDIDTHAQLGKESRSR